MYPQGVRSLALLLALSSLENILHTRTRAEICIMGGIAKCHWWVGPEAAAAWVPLTVGVRGAAKWSTLTVEADPEGAAVWVPLLVGHDLTEGELWHGCHCWVAGRARSR